LWPLFETPQIWVFMDIHDKKVVGVFVRFHCAASLDYHTFRNGILAPQFLTISPTQRRGCSELRGHVTHISQTG
jgi:hypothetical protein